MKNILIWNLLCFISTLIPGLAEDVPCQSRPGDGGQGFVCVCNSTYCDTIERPANLPKGHFHWYSTSFSTPGFSHTKGSFSQLSDTNDQDVVFKINASVRFQEILGFGGSFTDSASIVLNTLPEAAQDKLVRSYFGINGIEYSFGRLPIGATDFSQRDYTLDDVPFDDEFKNFSLAKEDYSYKIPIIKKAISLSAADHPIKVMACTWLSPAWMKDDVHSYRGYIKPKYFRAFAEYHLRYLEAYKDNGIDIWSLSGGNEVALLLLIPIRSNNLNCTIMTAAVQRQWVRDHLKPVLKNSNFSHVKLIAMEDMRPFALYWAKRFKADPEAYEAMDGIGIHWYLDFFSKPTMLDELHEIMPDKLILYTESSVNGAFLISGPDPVNLGSWRRGEAYIYNIIENLLHWAQSYVDWNLCLNHDGGPYLGLPVDSAIIVNTTSGEFYKQPIFYAMGHFSKFIPPGSRRILVESNQNHTLADERRAQFSQHDEEMFVNSRVTGTGGNISSLPVHIINIPTIVNSVATTNPDGSCTVIVGNFKNVTSHVRIEDARVGTISVDVEPYSVNSFIYWLD